MGNSRIVVGVDGSTGSLRALRWAVHEAQRRGGAIHAIMTYNWAGTEAALLAGIGPEGERRHAEDLLDQAIAGIRGAYAGVPIVAEAVLGNPAHTLIEVSRGADLLVVGSHGHGLVHHAVLGSVSEGCVRHATCPVVVVPAPHPQARPHTDLVDTGRSS